MNRKLFLQAPIVLLASIIFAAIFLVLWVVLFIPVMIRPAIVAKYNPTNKITEHVTRRAMQSAMRGMPHP